MTDINVPLFGSMLLKRFHAFRIKSIGPLEILDNRGGVQRKQIRLVDNEGVEMDFLLWGEQVVLANLFR